MVIMSVEIASLSNAFAYWRRGSLQNVAICALSMPVVSILVSAWTRTRSSALSIIADDDGLTSLRLKAPRFHEKHDDNTEMGDFEDATTWNPKRGDICEENCFYQKDDNEDFMQRCKRLFRTLDLDDIDIADSLVSVKKIFADLNLPITGIRKPYGSKAAATRAGGLSRSLSSPSQVSSPPTSFTPTPSTSTPPPGRRLRVAQRRSNSCRKFAYT